MVRMVTETPADSAARTAVATLSSWQVRVLTLASACALLAGCGTPYLMQAASGEWHVLHERVPIDTVLADQHTPEGVREHLEQVRAARQFASSELGLPYNDSYRSYADIGRPYVVWNVVAAPEFSVAPKRWCFPVAGCVAYRGYFHEQSARDFALELESQGLDVAVDGVPAYSTLGKFADPVLSSMLRYGDDDLAATIFHELAHQLLYVRDDSEFNEAFATTVEYVGLERWLAHQGATARMQAFRDEQQRERALVSLLTATRTRLVQLYASPLPRDELVVKKAEVFTQLSIDIRALERRQGVTYPLYEEWIAAGLNNARLASVATYFECVPGFTRLLHEQEDDLPRFYAAVRKLAELPRSERHARLCAPEPTATD
ncbi:MAG TPA: aminopeptidase [Steroidobacteraceae bacterium]|jgi:predicted aminopeptidase